MAEDRVPRNFTRFDGNNFDNWKFRISVLLDAKDLQEYIEKTLEEINLNINDDAVLEANRKKEKKCKNILVECIAQNTLEYIKDQETAKGIYDTLVSVFERKSMATRMFLRRKLITIKYNGVDSMTSYFLEFDKIVRELKSVGAKLENEDVICHLLLSLPESYESMVTALQTMETDKLTMEFVKGRLLDEHQKKHSENDSKSDENVAMHIKKVWKPNNNIKCYNCGKTGHIRANCRQQNLNKNVITANNSVAFYVNRNYEDKGEANDEKYVEFILDSGATDHMVNNERILSNTCEMQPYTQVSVAKRDVTIIAKKKGNIVGNLLMNNQTTPCLLKDVLLIEDLKFNLLSIPKMEAAGMEIFFKKGMAIISHNGKPFATAAKRGNLYILKIILYQKSLSGFSTKMSETTIWHQRMGHLNLQDLHKLMTMGTGPKNIERSEAEICESCIFGKLSRKPFHKRGKCQSNRAMELIHSDVCGPIEPNAWDGGKYIVSFIDDYTHFAVIYIIKNKSEVLDNFKKYYAMCEARFHLKIAQLQTDNGGEYTSKLFKNFCTENRIQQLFTVPYNPEQNGVAERYNRTIMNKARAMIIAAKMDKMFWNEAVLTANYLSNRSPTNAFLGDRKNMTPADIWYGTKPNLEHLKIFGCTAYCHVPKELRKKMDAKAHKGVMMGYAPNGYRIWDAKKQVIIIARNILTTATKNKNVLEMEDESSDEYVETEGAVESNNEESVSSDEFVETEGAVESNNEESVDTTPVQRRSSRERRLPEKYYDYDMTTSICSALNAEQYVLNDPMCLSEAKKSNDWNLWKIAINKELDALNKNDAWTLADLPEGRKAIQCKWIFKIKRNELGNITKYKARLVAKGFSQVKGFDYNETYAPVAKLTTFRVLLAVANHEKYHIHQMDVKAAFLNGYLNEEIYMHQPEGYQNGNKVCKLNRAIYGLKQSSKMWNERFHNFIIKQDFKRSDADRCLYTKIKDQVKFYLLLYVDDLVLVSESLEEIKILKTILSNEFEMTDLGDIKNYLGFYVERVFETGTMKLSQSQYLKNVLSKFNMSDCKSSSTPMEVGLKLDKSEGFEEGNKPYRELIGCLTYVTMTTRPDLSAATNYFSRFQSNFNEEHFMYAKRMLKYIKGTLNMCLVYKRDANAELLIGYADADWAGDHNDRKSTSGYVFKVFGCCVSWMSRKQTTVSLSSTEAEYVALTQAACEMIWLRQLLSEMGYDITLATTIYEDNQSCIKTAEQPRDHKRMKHIDVKHNFIREIISNGQIKVAYIATDHQLADIMTKALGIKQFNVLRRLLGLLIEGEC